MDIVYFKLGDVYIITLPRQQSAYLFLANNDSNGTIATGDYDGTEPESILLLMKFLPLGNPFRWAAGVLINMEKRLVREYMENLILFVAVVWSTHEPVLSKLPCAGLIKCDRIKLNL